MNRQPPSRPRRRTQLQCSLAAGLVALVVCVFAAALPRPTFLAPSASRHSGLRRLRNSQAGWQRCRLLPRKADELEGFMRYDGSEDEGDDAGDEEPPAPAVRYVGKVKSFAPGKGYGFIECAKLSEEHDCDVFLHERELHGVRSAAEVQGDVVTFAVEMNKDGRPQARDVERRFLGRVKSYSQAKGYGFIACDDFAEGDGLMGDVFLHRNQAEQAGIHVGEGVTFTMRYSDKGQPQARNVEPLLQGPAREEYSNEEQAYLSGKMEDSSSFFS
eukprot:TRINITY_DN83689_c0_g1_i1.p1 TRINITY_DN83689_c0_g1~~TRINITY_DN83689_c0_g1_i1.p1  ORF type:complete len:272 (-),score=77.15 TRINITY_DN83689_c0_g1_i1:126-941(-)